MSARSGTKLVGLRPSSDTAGEETGAIQGSQPSSIPSEKISLSTMDASIIA
jgi:hypothetical protein